MTFETTFIKLKQAYGVKTNSELAEMLNTTRGAVEGWSRRKEVPHKYLTQCTFDTGVSLDWLLSEDKPTYHISGGSRNISHVSGGVGIQETKELEKEKELELFEEFKKIENLAKMVNKIDFLKDELKKIKEELKKYI